MTLKLLLKLIPLKEIIKLAWSVLDPILLKKVEDSKSAIDDKVYGELRLIILKLITGV